MTKISSLINLDASAVSTIISRMEKKALVSREHDLLNDRRQVFVTITPQGKEILNNNRAVFEEHTESLFGNLNDSEREVLHTIVKKLNKNRENSKCAV